MKSETRELSQRGKEENVTQTTSLMKRIGIPVFLICDFVREQFGVPVNICDVQMAGFKHCDFSRCHLSPSGPSPSYFRHRRRKMKL
jgi:hypothetical protein